MRPDLGHASCNAEAMTEQTQKPTFDGVTSYLSWDHDRLEAILAGVCEKVDTGQVAAARTQYGEFDSGLLRHIRIEEELLFPIFEAKTGVVSGPTEVMREEHREIKRGMALMRDGLERGDLAAFREGLQFVRETLPSHNQKEEHVLYPTTDRLLSDSERLALVNRLLAE